MAHPVHDQITANWSTTTDESADYC